jgi:isoquinoline 1-oxidoreductase alpha subunit
MTRFTLIGEERTVTAAPDTPLLWVIRDELGLTGTKFGCGVGLCGTCRVHVDGELTASCQTPLSAVEGKKVTTIEGLAGKIAEAVFTAWEKNQVVQCGYCQPGQIMAAAALLTKHPCPPTSRSIPTTGWAATSAAAPLTPASVTRSTTPPKPGGLTMREFSRLLRAAATFKISALSAPG